jgi:hypothetical protein
MHRARWCDARQQAICIGRKVNPHDLSLFVHDVADKARVLVCVAVVVLSPNMRGVKLPTGHGLFNSAEDRLG